MIRHLSAIAAVILFAGFAGAAETAPNALSDEEKTGGWKLLFDGSSTAGWRSLGKEAFPSKGWVVEAGVLTRKESGGGDIATVEQFDDFELTWDWRIQEAGNSGLKYNLINPNKGVGCEYQLLDDAKHPDASRHGTTRQTGSLYDVIAPAVNRTLNPPGQWNSSRIIVKGNASEHWLNGAKVVAFEFGSEALKAAIAESKFKSTPGFGVKTRSPILLQDHGDVVSFRNMKVRALSAAPRP